MQISLIFLPAIVSAQQAPVAAPDLSGTTWQGTFYDVTGENEFYTGTHRIQFGPRQSQDRYNATFTDVGEDISVNMGAILVDNDIYLIGYWSGIKVMLQGSVDGTTMTIISRLVEDNHYDITKSILLKQ